ncbi:MAG: YbaK/EbsC family protein [Alphaproteobacteria bacterium]
MTIEKVKHFFAAEGKAVIELSQSSATVELAARALNTEPARIAKTLSFAVNGSVVLVVAAGDMKIDNHKFKDYFHCKAKMLSAEEVLSATGHAVGGVCPFALPAPKPSVYLDVSLQRFETVFPACGSMIQR